MFVLRRQVWSEMDTHARQQLFERGLDEIFDPQLRESISALVTDVQDRGDAAVREALERFDGVTVESLRVSADDLERARVGDDLEAAIDAAIVNLRAFNERQLSMISDWSFESSPGLTVGEKITPISSAGLFTPSGKASYPSVTYQLGVPAVVAGVGEIAVVVPPRPGRADGGSIVDPAVLVVCRKLGIRDVFCANGPAGIAALGFGTESIPRVLKVMGPGSPAVTLAQLELRRYGVSTVMLLGPTEAMIIADEHADCDRLALDLLIEAEHGTDSTVVLVATSQRVIDDTDAALSAQIDSLPGPRREAAEAALGRRGGSILVDDLDTAVEIANRFAPEHLQVAADEPLATAIVEQLVNAGEILVGQNTPFSAANFLIGCPASLPTSGFAQVTSGVTAATFLKRTAVASCSAAALDKIASAVTILADHEGFPAHANAIRSR